MMTPEELTEVRLEDALFKLGLIGCMFILFTLTILLVVCTLSPHCCCYPHCPCGRAQEKQRILKANIPRGEQIPHWKKKVSLHEINPSFWIPWNSKPMTGGKEPTLQDRLNIIGKREYDNLNPSIYKAYESFGRTPPESPVPIREAVSGTVIFSVRLDESQTKQGKYQISIKAIRNLRMRPYGGISYVYLKLHLLGSKKKNSKESVLDEKKTEIFTRKVETTIDEEAYLTSQTDFKGYEHLKISSYEFDKYSRHEWAGEVSVPLCDLDLSEEVMFTEDLMEPCQDFGEILVSLSYLPTSEKLHLGIIKCKNLTLRLSGDTLIFVKAVMLQGKSTLQKKRSRALEACSSPSYNETLTFDVPYEYLDTVTYLISVTHRNAADDGKKSPPSEGRSEMSERVIGTCSVGTVSEGRGQEHWMEMMQTPRKPTAMWHHLR